MAQDPNCIFCKIVAGQILSARVLETDSAIAFLDIAPVAPGHVLLAPKDHYERLDQMPPEAASELAGHLPRLARAVLAATGDRALNVVLNNGPEAGQLVDHLHFHLIPRRPGDEFHMHWPHGKYAGNELEQVRERIARCLQPDGTPVSGH
jgi:histidine triad (HIT) family protein